jgi:hypothetical protein
LKAAENDLDPFLEYGPKTPRSAEKNLAITPRPGSVVAGRPEPASVNQFSTGDFLEE